MHCIFFSMIDPFWHSRSDFWPVVCVLYRHLLVMWWTTALHWSCLFTDYLHTDIQKLATLDNIEFDTVIAILTESLSHRNIITRKDIAPQTTGPPIMDSLTWTGTSLLVIIFLWQTLIGDSSMWTFKKCCSEDSRNEV